MSTDLDRVAAWAEEYIAQRPPDFWVGPPGDHQMERWFVVPRNDVAGVMLHRFLRSDPEDPHDHPYDNTSWILRGEYVEHFTKMSLTRRRGQRVGRIAHQPHRIEIIAGPVISLFTAGPRIRSWGYHTAAGWIPQADYPSEPRFDGHTGELIYGKG